MHGRPEDLATEPEEGLTKPNVNGHLVDWKNVHQGNGPLCNKNVNDLNLPGDIVDFAPRL